MSGRLYPADAVSGAPEYSGRALRQTLTPLIPGATSARPLGGSSGVRIGTPSTTVSVSGSTWTVEPHSGVMDVQAADSAGPYVYAFDADETGSVDAAHATYARWDGIYVQLSDPAESDGTTNPGVAIVYVAGTAAASPAMPTTPARSMLLARIVVPASGGGSASVVWLAPSILGQIPVFSTLADLKLRNTAPTPGQVAWATDTSCAWSWTGTRWAPVGTPVFATTAALLAAIASPVVGATAMVGADEYRCSTAGSWKLWARPEVSWTPVFSGIPATVVAAKYRIRGGVVEGELRLTATGAATGSITFDPPLAYDIGRYTPMGQATLFDASASTRRVWQIMGGFSSSLQYIVITEGTTATLANATNPWNPWASGDQIDIRFSYRPTDAVLSI